MRHDRDAGVMGAVAGVLGLVLLVIHGGLSAKLGIAYAIPTTIVGALAVGMVLRGPLGQALAKRIHGTSSAELPPEQVLNELDELRSRLSELEERADFSERLLAQHRDGQGDGG